MELQNFFRTTLASGISDSDTTIPLNTAPTKTVGYLVIEPSSTTKREIIYYTSVSGNNVICPDASTGRGVGGTSAQSHSAGAEVIMGFVAEHYNDPTLYPVSWQSWTPSFSASGSMTFTSVTVDLARYVQIGKLVFFQLVATGTTGGTASNAIYFTLPVTAKYAKGVFIGQYSDGGGVKVGTAYQTSTTQVAVLKEDLTNFGLGSGRAIRCSGFYEIN